MQCVSCSLVFKWLKFNCGGKTKHISQCRFWYPYCRKSAVKLICRIQYKIALACFHIISGTAPSYLSELLHLYSPSCSLRSASDTRIFSVPRVCRTFGERSFQYIGPVIWNSLPFSVRHATSFSTFKSKLKTHLFSSAYWFLAFFLLFPSNPWLLCLCFCGMCVCGWVECLWVCVRV